MKNILAAACKNTRIWTAGVSSVLWRAGALFAVSFALIVSGTVVVLMMCLLRLADLSEKWDGDALGQFLLLRGQMAQTMNREFWQDPDADLLRLSDEFLHGLNRNVNPGLGDHPADYVILNSIQLRDGTP